MNRYATTLVSLVLFSTSLNASPEGDDRGLLPELNTQKKAQKKKATLRP